GSFQSDPDHLHPKVMSTPEPVTGKGDRLGGLPPTLLMDDKREDPHGIIFFWDPNKAFSVMPGEEPPAPPGMLMWLGLKIFSSSHLISSHLISSHLISSSHLNLQQGPLQTLARTPKDT
ncbi:hypothetical protein DV515_00011820, partial [Chloebia gouldiae]